MVENLAHSLLIPDIWQQEAVRYLQQGFDVVVDAPTGSGKTFIFELFVEQGLRRQAVYTVPTRALANDKLVEWRQKGWNVGISTGDVAERVDAPVVVATLETQKSKFLRGEGPGLLVIDEYQMLADDQRGINYELAVALAPVGTQLLLLSGSVANPERMVAWMRSNGREVVLVRHKERPVPLEEVQIEGLPDRLPVEVHGKWPRWIARALAVEMGPVLVFAPQRKTAEELARKLSAALPLADWLELSREQRQIAGDDLGKLLRNRIAYHHSGLSYPQRAGLIEPLAKAGQLRVIVATTGLAAGINFSMRSVMVTEREYQHAGRTFPVRPDELLQMFGRAGRRGLDAKGYVLVAPDRPHLSEAKPAVIRRTSRVDWPAFLATMHQAVLEGSDPVEAARGLARRLFSEKRIVLGFERLLQPGRASLAVEEAGKHPGAGRKATPMAPQPVAANSDGGSIMAMLMADQEASALNRAALEERVAGGARPSRPPEQSRLVVAVEIPVGVEVSVPVKAPNGKAAGVGPTRKVKEMLNSTGGWERLKPPVTVPLGETLIFFEQRWQPALQVPVTLEKVPVGNLCRLEGAPGRRYGRIVPVACLPSEEGQGSVVLVKWLARAVRAWSAQHRPTAPRPPRFYSLEELESQIVPLLPALTEGGVPLGLEAKGNLIQVRLDYAQATVHARTDCEGARLLNPPTREVEPADHVSFAELAGFSDQDTLRTTPAEIWTQLGLIDRRQRPTRRGVLASFFNHGEGLAVAAALEDASYPLGELIYDMANLRAGHRFNELTHGGGRLAAVCRLAYRGISAPGYLEHGLPPDYGEGASEVLAVLTAQPERRHEFLSGNLGHGDLERANVEWRSLLNHIAYAPDYDWARWREFQDLARTYVATFMGIPRPQIIPELPIQQRTRFSGRFL